MAWVITNTFLHLVDINCDDVNNPKLESYIICFVTFTAVHQLLFLTGYFLFVYKYWEVSWILSHKFDTAPGNVLEEK